MIIIYRLSDLLDLVVILISIGIAKCSQSDIIFKPVANDFKPVGNFQTCRTKRQTCRRYMLKVVMENPELTNALQFAN